MRIIIMCLTMVLTSMNLCYAGIAGLLTAVYGPNGPGASIMMLVGISIGGGILSWFTSVSGKGDLSRKISVIANCICIGIVLKAIINLLDPTLSLFGW